MAETSVKNQGQVSQICVKCGFCCSGLLYDQARLEDGEVDFARAIGLDVGADPRTTTGQKKFALPCPHLCGTVCSIYQQSRPKICSHFFCELASKFDRGELSQAESLQKVEEAQRLMRRIEPMLMPGENWTMARARWSSNRNKTPRSPGEAKFQMLMTALNLFLDRNFRKERQRIVSVEPQSMEVVEGE
jgi:hypothetical protein